MNTKTEKLIISYSPHVLTNRRTGNIMLDVVVSLMPALAASVILFGRRALLVTMVCVTVCVLSEYLFEIVCKKNVTVNDLSAVVTGILLGFNLPVNIPLWQAAFGSIVAIIVVKQLFGGIGQNFANPALTARIVMLLSFPATMAKWTLPEGAEVITSGATSGATQAVDSISSATPLEALANGWDLPPVRDLLLGLRGGSLGETCIIALLTGGVYLVVRRVITLHIPIAYLGTVFLFSWLLGGNPVYQLLSGGLVLGAIYMATDYSSSPTTRRGKIIFGIGCGIITVLIRVWGEYPGGVSYAILLMNILTPYINKWTFRKPFGSIKKTAKAG